MVRDTLIAFAHGESQVTHEGWEQAWDGEMIYVRQNIFIPAESRDSWSRVISIIEDHTETAKMRQSLDEALKRYRDLFNQSPMAIWEEDWSGVKTIVEGLRSRGVQDLSTYLRKHPSTVHELWNAAVTLNINDATLKLYRQPDIEKFWEHVNTDDVPPGEFEGFCDIVAALADGKTRHTAEGWEVAYDGEKINVRTSVVLPDEHMGSWARVIYTEEDITQQRLAEVVLRKKHQEESYQAGMKEIAAATMHNLRNQIAPLVLRVGRLRESSMLAPAERLCQALGELNADRMAPERKEKLERYVALTATKLVKQKQLLDEELAALTRQIAMVEEAVAEQERFSKVVGPCAEEIDISTLIGDAVDSVSDILSVDIAYKIDPRLGDLPPVSATGFVLKQVFRTLLLNAADAIRAAGKSDGQVEIRSAIEPGRDSSEIVHLEIRDNGCGISPDSLGRIFERGFTTKKDGQGGWGLHWCANTLIAMDGRIYVTSGGEGAGAELHVILPILDEDAEAA